MLQLVKHNLQPKDEERCFKYNSLKNAEILNNIQFWSAASKYFL